MNLIGTPVTARIDKRCTTASIAVHFASIPEPVIPRSFVEAAGDVYRFLAGHGVSNQQDLGGRRDLLDDFKLAHLGCHQFAG